MCSISIKSIIFGVLYAAHIIFELKSPCKWAKATIVLHNVTCVAVDKDFILFRTCSMEHLQGAKVKMNMYAVLLEKKPYNDIVFSFHFRKKDVSFVAFNFTYDFCKNYRRRMQVPFLGILMHLLQGHSNLNHSCPYSNDIIIKDQIFQPSDMRYVPLPVGEYVFKLNLEISKIVRGRFFVELKNY